MRTRKGRRIAIASVAAVVALAGTFAWLGREHIRFALAFESIGRNAKGYDEYRHRQTRIVFVSLPGGARDVRRDQALWVGPSASYLGGPGSCYPLLNHDRSRARAPAR